MYGRGMGRSVVYENTFEGQQPTMLTVDGKGDARRFDVRKVSEVSDRRFFCVIRAGMMLRA